MLGFVGNTSIIDCSVNGQYYTDNGFFPIIAGVDQACFTTANFSAVNMGPYYSSLGGAQAALRAGAKGTLVIITGNQPGVDLINSGVVDFAEANGLKGVSLTEDVPIADPACWRRSWSRPLVTAVASSSTSPARRCCPSCRRSSRLASSTR